MIKVLCKENIEEILENPNDFICDSFDKPIIKIWFNDNSLPVTLMVGQDDVTKEFYIVLEDEMHSTDLYPEDGENLKDAYNNIIEICKSGELCF